jgi:hypothetical protein
VSHFHIGENIPGYLPSHGPYVVDTESEAQAIVAQAVKDYLDEEADLPAADRRLPESGGDGLIVMQRPGDPTDQGYAYWWSRCDLADCTAEPLD